MGGLEDHPRLVSNAGRQRLDGQRLEHGEAVGQLERALRLGGPGQILVEVGAGERHHQRPVRPARPEALDRGCALPCVESDEQVTGLTVPGLRQPNPVVERAQVARPAERGDSIPVARSGRGGRDEDDVQSAHVRKPAHMSRRSGV